jgi:phosphatidylglycerol---prolipoprotein diacylglyceryl transferase
MFPVLLKIGPITIGSYGLMLAIAFLTTLWLLKREFEHNNFPGEWAYSVIMAAAIGGIVGARLYFILEHVGEFLKSPVSMTFSGSGLTWYGGFIGGLLAVLWTIHKFSAPDLVIADLISPLLLLGYGIGRIGCFLAGDGDYGPPSHLPWAMSFPHGIVPTDVPVHPTPLYELLMSLILFAILWRLRKRPHLPGMMLSGMLVFYGIERFVAEFWRLTPKILWGWMTMAQILSIISILIGVTWGLVLFKRQRASQTSAVAH